MKFSAKCLTLLVFALSLSFVTASQAQATIQGTVPSEFITAPNNRFILRILRVRPSLVMNLTSRHIPQKISVADIACNAESHICYEIIGVEESGTLRHPTLELKAREFNPANKKP